MHIKQATLATAAAAAALFLAPVDCTTQQQQVVIEAAANLRAANAPGVVDAADQTTQARINVPGIEVVSRKGRGHRTRGEGSQDSINNNNNNNNGNNNKNSGKHPHGHPRHPPHGHGHGHGSGSGSGSGSDSGSNENDEMEMNVATRSRATRTRPVAKRVGTGSGEGSGSNIPTGAFSGAGSGSGTGSGPGSGSNILPPGNFSSGGAGFGSGSGSNFPAGNFSGAGSGAGSGSSIPTGSFSGAGAGSGVGSGSNIPAAGGSFSGAGSGTGSGLASGSGIASGSGSGMASGSGSGSGSGNGSGMGGNGTHPGGMGGNGTHPGHGAPFRYAGRHLKLTNMHGNHGANGTTNGSANGTSGSTQIVSEAGSGANFSRVAFQVDADRGQGVAFRVAYNSGEDTAATATSTVSYESSRVVFHEIVEYVDTDGNGVYTDGEAVSHYRLGKGRNGESGAVDWTRTYTAPPAEDGDAGIHELTLASSDGVLSFAVRFSGATVNDAASGTELPPTAIKYDIRIKDFPYANATHGRLAMVTLQRSASAAVLKTTDEEGLVSRTVTRAMTLGTTLFAWADTVQATPASGGAAVTASVVVPDPAVSDETYAAITEDDTAKDRDEKTFRTVFNFDAVAPASIVWDPVTGMDPSVDSLEAEDATPTPSTTVDTIGESETSSTQRVRFAAGIIGVALLLLAL